MENQPVFPRPQIDVCGNEINQPETPTNLEKSTNEQGAETPDGDPRVPENGWAQKPIARADQL